MPLCHLGGPHAQPGIPYEEEPREKRGAQGSASPAPALPILSAVPLPKPCPLPKAPFTLLSVVPAHPGFQPPPGSLLRCPPAQPVSTLSFFGPPQIPSTVNSLDCGVQPVTQEMSMTEGGDWGTPTLPQLPASPSVSPSPPNTSPSCSLCPHPWRWPPHNASPPCPLHRVSQLGLKCSGLVGRYLGAPVPGRVLRRGW